ncbi:helix-turn-helix transcriptional regulator [Wukongibacter baidiensis]|uniref:helix-turn-helix domain-containing protein n=1 Tax=Wukongibacter baidiensis TaxID=1723361 RepID=UPI003D7FCE5B
MGFSFNPLWKLLIDKNMTKEDLRIAIKTSPSTIAKMGKNEYVSMRILDSICKFFNCKIEDIVEYVPEEKGD